MLSDDNAYSKKRHILGHAILRESLMKKMNKWNFSADSFWSKN